MTISKEERAELRERLREVGVVVGGEWNSAGGCESNWIHDRDGELCLVVDPDDERLATSVVNVAPRLLDALDASDERIAGLEDALRDLGARDDKLTLELASAFHNLATNVVEAVGHAILQGRVLDGAKARITSLEAECQRADKAADELKEAKRRIVELVARANVHADSMIEQLDICSEHKARIAELEAAAQWRLMDTAPRDGTKILVAGRGTEGESSDVLEWTNEAWLIFAEEFSAYPEVVMRWLPIPALPEGGAK